MARAAAAFVTLAALAVNIGLAAAALLMGVRLVEAAPRVSGAGAHALLLVIAAALAASCVLVDRTPHAGLIAVLGVVLAIITLGWAMAYALVTWLRVEYATVADVLAVLVGLVPPALALSLLIVLLRPVPAPSGTPSVEPELSSAAALPESPDPATSTHLGTGRGHRSRLADRWGGRCRRARPAAGQPAAGSPRDPGPAPLVGSGTRPSGGAW